jgi:hypothetical protein
MPITVSPSETRSIAPAALAGQTSPTLVVG